MASNLDRYKNDLDALIDKGYKLHDAIRLDCYPERLEEEVTKRLLADGADAKTVDAKTRQWLRSLPSFRGTYQSWYSAAKALVRQLLPDRVTDLVRFYEKPKSRKVVSFENYTIEDHLQGLIVTSGGWQNNKVVGPEAAISNFRQQLAIVESALERFESSLFDIRSLVQADLFDSELDAAEELAKNKFERAAGALAGVVLERHLMQVCANHTIKVSKKNPTIGDLNDVLKEAAVFDVPDWRFIQHLADIRNLCDHQKNTNPTPAQVGDLITGVRKIAKTLL